MENRGAALALHDIRQTFDADTRVLRGISAEVAAGGFVGLLGPSGAGKSTLLRIIAGLLTPTAGQVVIEAPPPPRLSFIFQQPALLPWLRLADNIALPLRLQGADRASSRAQAGELAERVGLGEALGRYPRQLSVGMQMRASLARALAVKPQLLLLDEPLAAVDALTRLQLNLALRRWHEEDGWTAILVTHSIEEAVFLCDRILVLRDGRLTDDVAVEAPVHRGLDWHRDPARHAQVDRLTQALLA